MTMLDPDALTALLDPADTLLRQNQKLLQIVSALMARVEQETNDSGAAYAQFQRAVLLEDQVRERTRDLERALDLLNLSNGRLAEANRATEAARRNLANAIETVQEGFALFDPSDHLVLCNSRFGMHLRDIHPALKPGLAFADYVRLVSTSRGLALPNDETPQDWAARRMRTHLDRHAMFNVQLAQDRWLQVSEHRTPDGGTVILQTDVTDIILMERETRGRLLDDQARILRATLDHLNQGVCIFDAGQRLVGWNQRLGTLLSIALPRLRLGTDFTQLLDRFAPDSRFETVTLDVMYQWAASTAPRQPLRFTLQRGDDRVLDVFAQEMPDRGFVISFTDVTAERKAIAALSRANETLEARVIARTLDLEDALADAERANASRARFVAAASHDLLQPLSAARLFIASVEDETTTDEVSGALLKAQNALDSVDSILGALLDISKLDSGKAAITVGPVDLGRLLTQLAEEFAPRARAKSLTLRVRPAPVRVVSDATYLRRILQNLIGNAIRYTDQGGVLVGLRRRGMAVQLEVWDSGLGIPEDEQDNIFKEFHRLNSRASASEGMGLGLAIVERAAALLGHPLGLRSVLGRGSCFLLQLPLAEADAALNPVAQIPPNRSQTLALLQDRIVLLIEPDDNLRRAMGLLLEKWGMNVLDARTCDEAHALIDEIGILPDVLLVDPPQGQTDNAVDMVAVVRRRAPGLPCCLIVADRVGDIEETCAANSIGVLRKPVDAQALQGFLAEVLC